VIQVAGLDLRNSLEIGEQSVGCGTGFARYFERCFEQSNQV
jgi:hypothetical protein